MKSFIKTFFACLLAIMVSFGVMFFISMAITFAFSSMFAPSTQSLISKNVLKITFSEPVTDNPNKNIFAGFNPYTMEVNESMSLLKVVTAIEAAKNDPNIAGIYFEPQMTISMGMAAVEEVREALVDFKNSGKFLIAYADAYSQGAYYLASAADKVYVNPMGLVEFRGMSSTVMFFKGTLEKLGVEPQIIRHGTYKSAVEPFTNSEMSEANRTQTESLLGSIWSGVLDGVASSRSLNADELQQKVNNLEISSAQAAKDAGLVDDLWYKDQVIEYMKELCDGEKLPAVTLPKYINTITVSNPLSENKIAVVYAEGDIIDGKSAEGQVGSVTLSQELRKAREDKDVKAVVLRVNSPGGSVLASEVMWREVVLIQKEKPIIVSMGNYAASGGYYISAPADAIICSPATITGSIGVFGMMFNAEKGLKDKLGITTSTVKTAAGADLGTVFRPITSIEKAVVQNQVESIYNIFVGHVAEGRNLSVERVDSIGEGRVWSGAQAVENGLADGFGGLKHAVMLAAERAGVATDYRITSVSADKTPFEQFLSAIMEAKISVFDTDPMGKEYQNMMKLIRGATLQARMPYTLIVE